MRFLFFLAPCGGFNSFNFICDPYPSVTFTKWETFRTIPRMAGVSLSLTVRCIFVNPSPCRVLRWVSGLLFPLRINVTWIILSFMPHPLPEVSNPYERPENWTVGL